jgi:hypothetical protein
VDKDHQRIRALKEEDRKTKPSPLTTALILLHRRAGHGAVGTVHAAVALKRFQDL